MPRGTATQRGFDNGSATRFVNPHPTALATMASVSPQLDWSATLSPGRLFYYPKNYLKTGFAKRLYFFKKDVILSDGICETEIAPQKTKEGAKDEKTQES